MKRKHEQDKDTDVEHSEVDAEKQIDDEALKPVAAAKKKKRGIIYLSTIPKHMTVSIARDMFNQYADVGRMFFQPATKPGDDGEGVAFLFFLFCKQTIFHSIFQTNPVATKRKRNSADRRVNSLKVGWNSKANGPQNTLLHGSTVNRLQRERAPSSMIFCGA